MADERSGLTTLLSDEEWGKLSGFSGLRSSLAKLRAGSMSKPGAKALFEAYGGLFAERCKEDGDYARLLSDLRALNGEKIELRSVAENVRLGISSDGHGESSPLEDEILERLYAGARANKADELLLGRKCLRALVGLKFDRDSVAKARGFEEDKYNILREVGLQIPLLPNESTEQYFDRVLLKVVGGLEPARTKIATIWEVLEERGEKLGDASGVEEKKSGQSFAFRHFKEREKISLKNNAEREEASGMSEAELSKRFGDLSLRKYLRRIRAAARAYDFAQSDLLALERDLAELNSTTQKAELSYLTKSLDWNGNRMLVPMRNFLARSKKAINENYDAYCVSLLRALSLLIQNPFYGDSELEKEIGITEVAEQEMEEDSSAMVSKIVPLLRFIAMRDESNLNEDVKAILAKMRDSLVRDKSESDSQFEDRVIINMLDEYLLG